MMALFLFTLGSSDVLLLLQRGYIDIGFMGDDGAVVEWRITRRDG